MDESIRDCHEIGSHNPLSLWDYSPMVRQTTIKQYKDITSK